jgi:hypothetical protein
MRRLILSIAFLGTATVASAQPQVGPGWSAFSGCWTPVSADGERNIAANTPRVCVVPSGNSADLITMVADTIKDRTTVDAGGARHDVSKQGCSGWEKAEFSADGRRLYLSGEQTCAGGLKRRTSGVFAIASNGDWINAVDVAADSVSSVRVSRYATSSVTPLMPASIRDALTVNEVSDRTARVSAQRPVTVDAVIEASRFLSPAAEEAWLAELDQDFNLDDRTLVRLADEKVAPSVIDVLVAVSNPKVFSVASTGAVERAEERDSANVRRGYSPCFAPVVDPWAWYAYDPCDPYLRFSYYRPYYSRYGYGYGRYYDPFYGPYYGSPYYGGYGPVIIVRNDGNPNHGRMTKDGYKPSYGGSTGTASGGSSEGGRATRPATRRGAPKDEAPAASSSDRGSSSGSSGSSSSSGSTSGSSGSSGSGSSTGRVATRKPPA